MALFRHVFEAWPQLLLLRGGTAQKIDRLGRRKVVLLCSGWLDVRSTSCTINHEHGTVGFCYEAIAVGSILDLVGAEDGNASKEFAAMGLGPADRPLEVNVVLGFGFGVFEDKVVHVLKLTSLENFLDKGRRYDGRAAGQGTQEFDRPHNMWGG